jgi:glycosyltransferase involved in cell wall biosynthesis
MLFSIVTVVFNGAATIAATIESVAQQSFRDFEYLVLDGASTDATVDILEKHSEQIDYQVSEPDSGIYHAWNKALARARGDWVAFLGADDVLLPDALATYASAIRVLPDSKVHYISSRVHLARAGKIVRTFGSRWSWPAFSRYMTVAHVGSMHHRSLFAEYGQYDETYRVCADYELLLRPRERLQAAFVDRVTARMAFGGVSSSNVRLALMEQERAKRTTGGRAAWRCALERRTAYCKDRCRSLVWY